MKKILLIIPLLILIPIAAAEKITINVPFDVNGYNCTISNSTKSLEYTCNFQGTIQTFTEQDLMKFESVLTSEQIEQALDDIKQEELKRIAEEKKKLTFTERMIETLDKKLERNSITTNELQYLKLLKSLDQCEQGLGKSRQIQEYRSFDISMRPVDDLKNFEYSGYFGKLVKAIEECKGQQTLENKTLSEQYNHIIGSDVLQYDIRNTLEGIQAIPFDKFRATSNEVDINPICNDFRITESHKKTLGCVIQYDGKSLREIEMENEKKFGNNGMMEYSFKILNDYREFMKTYNEKNP